MPRGTDPRESGFPSHARKRFGQHFLTDEQAITDIVRYLALSPTDVAVEIGPGRGALTKHLVATGTRVEAVEIDRDLISGLRAIFTGAERVTIHEADALTFDFANLAAQVGKLRIIGNLPYNIATPLLFRFLQIRECVADMCLMVQKEVAERLTGQPSTPDYGRLSVMVQAYMHVDQILDVEPAAFSPPPKVDSCVVSLRPRVTTLNAEVGLSALSNLVAAAFAHRRKMLRHTLGKLVSEDTLEKHQIKLSQRPEEISVEQYLALAHELARSPSTPASP
ncbi:MAG: 16S rRNA (adenine(1518)-N(6)/adenine(1519)-N(6))-dimethyltransferase RsmA [Gammaproteobacteria bacterium]|nr:16S rRNA (adenine(1518)-N(6)/adenine(1519)-N(6))-dimethyltransferase RsmA [Gammaproteobacteria bacterium]